MCFKPTIDLFSSKKLLALSSGVKFLKQSQFPHKRIPYGTEVQSNSYNVVGKEPGSLSS